MQNLKCVRQFDIDTEQVLALSRLACLSCIFQKRNAVIFVEKEKECLRGYENKTRCVLFVLKCKYLSFFPFLYIVNRFFHMKYSW